MLALGSKDGGLEEDEGNMRATASILLLQKDRGDLLGWFQPSRKQEEEGSVEVQRLLL